MEEPFVERLIAAAPLGEYQRAKSEQPCWHCGKLIPWVEIHYEAFLCPGECTRAKDAEFFADLRILAAGTGGEGEDG